MLTRLATLMFAATLLAATGAAMPVAGAAAPVRKQVEAERKLDAVRAQIAALTAQQHALQGRRGALADALRSADAAVAAAARARRQTDTELAAQQAQLAQLQQQQAALQATLTTQRAELAALVRAAYALGRHQQLKMLLAQDRTADLARVLGYHRYFRAARSARIRGLLAQLQTLAALTTDVEAKRTQLAATRLDQQQRVAALQTQRAARQSLLATAEKQFDSQAARIAALGRDQAAMLRLLQQLRRALAELPVQIDAARPFAQRRGALAWPLAGSVLTSYGARLPDGRASTGLLIAGAVGADVHAVSPGRVAFADWLKGYGLIVIVEHGGGWMTLYANNDALLKKVGDAVRAGDPIATVGNSGGQVRPALYFELRKQGKPVDPYLWLRDRAH